MSSTENATGFRKTSDMGQAAGLILLLLNFYYYCYDAFVQWKLTAKISDRIMVNIGKTGLFSNPYKSKLIALAFLALSLLSPMPKRMRTRPIKKGCTSFWPA
jgi:hypothetical protein